MSLYRRAYILAKIEGTYGTDPVPTEASDAIIISNIAFEVLNNQLTFDHLSPYMGRQAGNFQNNVNGAQISFDVEFKGNGTAVDSPPEIGVLLRACNWTETINAATDVTYSLNSLAFQEESSESITIYYKQSEILHEINGARGTWSMSADAGAQAIFSFTFTGLHQSAVVTTQSALTVTDAIPPRFVESQFTYDSYSACIQNIGIDLGNVVVPRECANDVDGIKEYGITDRLPTLTINPETPAIATKDFWSLFENTTESAVSFRIGTDTLNRGTFTIPKSVINASPNYVDRNGITAQNITANLQFDSGNDEITIVFD